MRNFLLLCLTVVMLAGCGGIGDIFSSSKKTDPTYGYYKVGNPYKISGKWYRPHVDYDYEEIGIASWYGKQFHGKKTANGAIFNMNDITAAHRTLPLPSWVVVENLENGKKLKVLVNDRGPFYNDRIIDLSRETAKRLGVLKAGTARVKVTLLADESSKLAGRLGGRTGSASASIAPKAVPTGTLTSQELSPVKSQRSGWRNSTQAQAAESNDDLAKEVLAATAQGGDIYIQVGAYSQYANAVGAQRKLYNLGTAELWQTQGSPPLYRVRLGPFGTANDAANLLKHVRKNGFDDAQVITVKTN